VIRLFDSINGAVTEIVPRTEGQFSMYVCGPTVNDVPHLGHGRMALVWDVLRRWITFTGLEVIYVSNVTDVDDKIIERARLDGRSPSDVVADYEGQWWSVMDALGVARPTFSPHATEYIDQMISLVSALIEKDVAYVIDDGVYFDVSAVPDYGCLSGQPLAALRATERVEPNIQKRSPLDFAVWKAAKAGEPSWDTPFGPGRPGWHTECVAMSLDLLGENFDLHTGGQDLRFPHHENERAQAVALGRGFARHWSHHGFVMAGEQKMSNSLGNFTSLADLLTSIDQRAYRLLVLRSHYRQPIDVSASTMADAVRALARLDSLARRFDLPALAGTTLERFVDHPLEGDGAMLLANVSDRLNSDLDTSGAVALLFESLTRAHALADAGDDSGIELAQAVNVGFGALGLPLRSDRGDVDDASAALIAARDAARVARDWIEADRLRDELVAAGWVVEDGVGGTFVHR
jgi:cysteinyl-tRNA synthetase